MVWRSRAGGCGGGALVLALLVAGCGSHARPVGQSKDSELAHQILAEQLGSVPRGWRKVAAPTTVRSDASRCTRSNGATAVVFSPSLSYKGGGFDIVVEDAVYPSVVAARRAVRDTGRRSVQSCRARFLISEIRRLQARRRIRVGRAALSGPKVVRAGSFATATQIAIPMTFRGRHAVVSDESILVSEGRVVSAVATASYKPITAYDAKVARVLAADAKAVENHAPSVGHFAGYHETDMVVHQLSATFIVPHVKFGHSYSDAATWVGAEVLGKNDLRLPFIQAGISEDESNDQPPTDTAFWSDTAHHFDAVPLFSVRPGDKVSISLTHARRH